MEDRRRETLFGIDPYTYNFSHIYRALPRRERDYFKEFVEADMEERLQILQLVPENERALYIARWQLRDAGDLKKAMKKGLLSEEEIAAAQEQLEEHYKMRETEGLPTSRDLWVEYLATRLQGESYADWYRRVYLLAERLEGRPLPGHNWVGWHPAVSLQDIKLKIVQDEGRNMFEYDLWPDQARLVARRPIVAEAAEQLREAPGMEDSNSIRQRVKDILTANGLMARNVNVLPTGGESTIDISIEEDRRNDILRIANVGGLRT
jgi:hypothetical protein